MKRRGAAAALAGLLALAFTAIATFQPFNPARRQPGQVRTYWVVVLIILVALAVTFALVVPRTSNYARTSLILGAVALVSVLVFWSGLPFVLGVGAMVLGVESRRGGARLTMSTVGVALAALALVLGGILCFAG